METESEEAHVSESKPALTEAEKKKLIEDILKETKDRWMADSSKSILCCTESRVEM